MNAAPPSRLCNKGKQPRQVKERCQQALILILTSAGNRSWRQNQNSSTRSGRQREEQVQRRRQPRPSKRQLRRCSHLAKTNSHSGCNPAPATCLSWRQQTLLLVATVLGASACLPAGQSVQQGAAGEPVG